MDVNINKLIIQLIKPEEFIYNKQHQDYVRKKGKKDDGFKGISQAVFMNFHQNIPAKEIEQRWETLLLKYKAEKKKIHTKPKSGSGAAVKMDKWEYYDDFSYLDNCLDHRRVKSSIETPSSSCSSSQLTFYPNSKNKVIQQEQLPSTSFSKPTLASKFKKRVMPEVDEYAKRKKKQSDELDEEINAMKMDLKKAIENIVSKGKEVR